MKYHQRLVSSSAPASLQEWLAEELERRGIDGVYTRYILSLLLADTVDPTECSHFAPHLPVTTQVSENRLGDKSRHRRLKSWEHKKEQQGLLVQQCQRTGHACDCCQTYLDNEQRKKLAAVECLKSASEQKGGIEKLIDEVCAKLKNFQADIETNPDSRLHAEIKAVSKQSSPQGQTELYYAAFPALSDKPEPLGELCRQTHILQHQQDVWTLKSSAWGKENCSWTGKKHLDIHKLGKKNNDQEKEDDRNGNKENDVEKGEVTGTESDSCHCSKLLERGLSKETEFLENVEPDGQPLFIVPKMKVPPTRVANITMYTPFTSAATYQQQGVGPGKVPGEEDPYSDEGGEVEEEEEEIIEGGGGTLLTADEPCLTWKLLLPTAEENNELVTDLVSKFNSELAAIWENGGSIEEPSLNTDNLGISFSILSVRSPLQEEVAVAPPTSINFFIGSSLPSVWSAKTQDIKILHAHEPAEFPESLSSSHLNPGFTHNLASKVDCTREDSQSLLWSSEEDSDFLLDDGSSLKSFKLDLSEQAWEDISQACEASSEDRNTLFVCPDALFVDPEDNERPASFSGSSDCLSPLENSAEVVTGIYSLWESPSPQPPFPLKGEVLCLPLTAAPYCDKVVNWISHQREILNGNWHDSPMGKENRTLTYHKGESRFKEVVPLTRMKMESAAQELSFPESNMSLHLDDCRDNNKLDKPDEPEENLLTSPKTHFQPIRQDSSETDSLSDTLDMLDPQLLLISPHHHNHNSPLVVLTPPATRDVEELKEDSVEGRLARSVSSSMDEMLFLTGQFDQDEEGKTGDRPDTLDVLQAFQAAKFKPEMLLLEDKSTSTDALYPAVDRDDLGILSFGPFQKDQIWATDTIEEQSSELSLPWKWSTTDDSEDMWRLENDDNQVEDAFEDETNFKKTALDCTLEAMRKELEEEEEELFRDINLLSDSEDFEAAFGEDFALFSLNDGWSCGDTDVSCTDDNSPPDTSQVKQWDSDTTLTATGQFSDDLQNNVDESVKLPSVPMEKVLYSSELESEWHKASQSFNVQVPKKGKVKTKVHGQQQQQQQQQQQRKPCSFFLEGNCRRSDCKFSHNLGSITCRFWEEGSCFKGITCPFLHGYASDPSICSKSSGKCKFALESEADFPSLSTLSTSEPSCKSFPKELLVGRIIRPKKKKMGPVMAPSGVKKSSSPLPPK